MLSIPNRFRELFIHPDSMHSRPLTRRIVLGLAFFSLFMIILSTDFISDKISLQEGQVSERDVVAPRTASYVNGIKTRKLEADIKASVASVYDFDVSVIAQAEDSVNAIYRSAKVVAIDQTLNTPEKKLEKLQSILPVSLSAPVMRSLLAMDEISLHQAEEQTKNILRKYFQRGVREDDISIVKQHIARDIEASDLGNEAGIATAGIAQALVKPNFVLNSRETDKRKQAALTSVEPVRETVKKGQVLVSKGDVVTIEQIQAMEELGLYRGQVSEIRIIGLAIFLLVVMTIVMGYLYKFIPEVFNSDLHLVLLGLSFLISLALGRIAHSYSSYDFAAPVAAGALLTAILINSRLGVFFSLAIAMLFGVIVEHDLRAVTVVLIGSLTGVYSVSKRKHGYSLTKTGVWIGAANCLTIISTGMLTQQTLAHIMVQSVQGIFSGIASAIITIGLLPYLEHTFKVTSPYKLLDLGNPGHPLLQRLLFDAPGTYHHSILVGNLAETAADVIDANPIVVRVAAYYHDIGKIRRPFFFVENQIEGENPHDKIAPSLSTLIVTSHIKDGVDLLRENKMPQTIIDIVQQHHGTMLVSYFYKRATENEHGECVIEADFRYEGPRPQTKEAALVMLADACEASVRSLSKPTSNRIEATVRKMIRQRLQEGQLDDCNLTLKDLNTVGDVFIRVLSSMFHSRIEYPDMKDLERRKTKNGNSAKQSAGKDSDNAGADANNNGRAVQGC